MLLGGPEQSGEALLILHNTEAAGPESHNINDMFSFLSYRYVVIPGKPPAFLTANNSPGTINLKRKSDFLVVMGYRQWEGGLLQEEINSGQWVCLPATPDIVFNTNRHERRNRLLNKVN